MKELTQYGIAEMKGLIETVLAEGTPIALWQVIDQHIHALHVDVPMPDEWYVHGTIEWQACLYDAASMAWSAKVEELDYVKQAIALRLQHTLNGYL